MTGKIISGMITEVVIFRYKTQTAMIGKRNLKASGK